MTWSDYFHHRFRCFYTITYAFSMMVSSSVAAAELNVSVTGQKSTIGDIVVVLFSSEKKDMFPKDIASAMCTEKIQSSLATVQLTCTNIAIGKYALLAFHDQNRNGVVDHSFIGLPKEKIGMSSNCKGIFGPPKFVKCAFNVSEPSTKLLIELN